MEDIRKSALYALLGTVVGTVLMVLFWEGALVGLGFVVTAVCAFVLVVMMLALKGE